MIITNAHLVNKEIISIIKHKPNGDVFHPFKVDTISYLPYVQSRWFKDKHDYIMEIYL